MEELTVGLVDEAVEIIETDFPMLAGVDELAERLGVSKCHLIRCFTRERGTPPGKYLVQIRISAVMAYLTEENYTVDTIAGLTGFACGNYLCKVFRRTTGQSPGEYRRARQITPGDSALVRRVEDISYL